MSNTAIIEERLRFLEIDQAVIEDLHKARQILEPSIDRMLDVFYARIADEPHLKTMFSDESMNRARNAQKNHWLESLLAGEFTGDHFSRADHIGRAHARAGLTPNWYIGGYSRMLTQFVQHILAEESDDGNDVSPVIEALCKAVMLDLDLVIQCYLEAKDRVILDLLMQATRFIDDLSASNNELRTASEKVKDTALVMLEKSNGQDVEPEPIEELLAQAKILLDRARHLDERIDDLKNGEQLYLQPGTEHTGTFSQVVSQVID